MKKILLDGGLGQELLARWGKPAHPLWSAQVMMEAPELVQSIHEDYIRAGAKVITTNSYILTPERLTREGVPDQFRPLQQLAIDLANAARDAVGIDVDIAGCLPPLHGSYKPDLSRSADFLYEKYREIAVEQVGKVDLMICETLASISEVKGATKAALELGVDVWTSMTADDDHMGKLRSGEDIIDAIVALKELKPHGVLFNCSRPETIDVILSELAIFDHYGAYANGFTHIGGLEVGGTVASLSARQDLTSEKYAEFAMAWIESEANIVGGCCETTPAHISVLSKRMLDAGLEISTWRNR